MKRVLRIGLASLGGLLLLVAGVWLLSISLNDRAKTFSGKPVEYWLEQLVSTNPAARQRATNVVNEQIIPELTRVLFTATNESALRLAVIDQLEQLPGIHIFHISPEGQRSVAAHALGNCGPAARAAMPALLQALQGRDDAVRGPAAKALIQIQPDPDLLIPPLIQYLGEPEGSGRDEAAEALAEFGPRAKAAVPILVKLLDYRGDKDLMRAVRHALKTIDPDVAAKAGLN
jgi:HEAT repeat protein